MGGGGAFAFGAGGAALTGVVTLKNPQILKPLGLETGDEIVDAAQAKFNIKRLQKIEQSASKELTAKETIQNLKDTYGKKPSKAENELVYSNFNNDCIMNLGWIKDKIKMNLRWKKAE